MIVVFANQKGGVGKSTLCALFAHYLSDSGKEVHLIDMDFQKTLERMRKTDVNKSVHEIRNEEDVYENPLKFTVDYVSVDNLAELIEKALNDKDRIYLFDAPGNLGHKNIMLTLYHADFIIVPFQYDTVTLDSTAVFIQLLNKFSVKGKIFFIPNKIDQREKIAFAEKTNEIFERKGRVTPVVNLRVEMKRLSTLIISKLQQELVEPAFSFIFNDIFIKNKS